MQYRAVEVPGDGRCGWRTILARQNLDLMGQRKQKNVYIYIYIFFLDSEHHLPTAHPIYIYIYLFL